MGIEDDLLNSEPKVPVYFAYEEAEILDIYSKVSVNTRYTVAYTFFYLIHKPTL